MFVCPTQTAVNPSQVTYRRARSSSPQIRSCCFITRIFNNLSFNICYPRVVPSTVSSACVWLRYKEMGLLSPLQPQKDWRKRESSCIDVKLRDRNVIEEWDRNEEESCLSVWLRQKGVTQQTHNTMICQGTKETFQGKASRSLLDLLTGSKIRNEGQKGQAKNRI